MLYTYKTQEGSLASDHFISIVSRNSYHIFIHLIDVKQFGDDGYGAKANKVLSSVRGKDFRHEKTKRKRGTYRGGSISMESNSFKYDDEI